MLRAERRGLAGLRRGTAPGDRRAAQRPRDGALWARGEAGTHLRTCSPGAPPRGESPAPRARPASPPPSPGESRPGAPAGAREAGTGVRRGTQGGPDVADGMTRLDVNAERDTKSNSELPPNQRQLITNTVLALRLALYFSRTFSSSLKVCVLCTSVLLASVCTTCVPGARGSPKRASDPQELELWMAVSVRATGALNC